jgi:O-methyltransferase
MSEKPGLIRELRRLGVGVRWRAGHLFGTPIPADFDSEQTALIKRVRRYSLGSAERLAALADAVAYLVSNEIEGDLVECGVWRGGSMMAAALTLIRLGETDRDLYLFDTFSGMAQPSAEDVRSPYDMWTSVEKRFNRRRRGRTSDWAAVPAEQVRRNMESTGYPAERIHLVEGLVEDTLPAAAPPRLALLRLDTDWYASTKHELEHLYPRLVDGGVLIVDDYGHYEGARRAVDEYFAASGEPVLLNRIDYTGRIAVRGPSGQGVPS